jgi:hypothetical protein
MANGRNFIGCWGSGCYAAEDGVEGAGGVGAGNGFFIAQGLVVIVAFEFLLHLQELFVGQHNELLASVFINDLWVDAHGGLQR